MKKIITVLMVVFTMVSMFAKPIVLKSDVGFLVANDEKYVFVKTNSFDISSFGSVLSNYIDLSELTKLDSSKVEIDTIGECKSYTVPAWKGNDIYYVFMLYPCGGQTKVFRYDDITISMIDH